MWLDQVTRAINAGGSFGWSGLVSPTHDRPGRHVNGHWYPTDPRWFEYLSRNEPWDEVNFWQPRGYSSIGKLERGAPFFFKLTRPHNQVAGFGFFDRHLETSVELAWEAFQTGNGAADFGSMVRGIEGHRGIKEHDPSAPYRIGCLMIQEPVFFPREDWIPVPSTSLPARSKPTRNGFTLLGPPVPRLIRTPLEALRE